MWICILCGHFGVAERGEELRRPGCEHCPPHNDIDSPGTPKEESCRGRSASRAACGATEWEREDASPPPRRRRRSRSYSAKRPTSPSSDRNEERGASGADVTRSRFSLRDVEKIPEEAKEELRQVRRKKDYKYQLKFSDVQWPEERPIGSAGSMIPGISDSQLREQTTAIASQLPEYSNPMPSTHEFVNGMPHQNGKREYEGQMWDVVRAIASTKVKYLPWLSKELELHRYSDPDEWLFASMCPDTSPASGGGAKPMTPDGLEKWCSASKGLMKDSSEFLKHLLTYHDGEARVVIDKGYEPLPAGVDFHEACFWPYQYAKILGVRQWLFKRWVDKDQSPLSDSDIQHILEKEDNHTSVLRWVPRNPAWQPLARGDRMPLEEGDWQIRTGNYITLAELFRFGAKGCTCYDLYKMWLGSPSTSISTARSTLSPRVQRP